MPRIFTIFFLCTLGFLSAFSQTTIQKDGKEFFNGDDRHLRVYLNNNYDQLDPIEGIWIFTRIEYNTYGQEVSRTPNEITAAIVRDPGHLRRAFVEVNMSRAFCKDYQITYSIQTGGGSGYYPCEPKGCGVISGQYYFDYQQKTLSRPAISLMGNRAVLVGIKTYPQGPPKELMSMPGGVIVDPEKQVTPRRARIIEHKDGWEPYISWGAQLFPVYLLSMGKMPNNRDRDDRLGDQFGNVGIIIKNPARGTKVTVEIEATKFTKNAKETFLLEERGKQYFIVPTLSWDYTLLRSMEEAERVDFTYHVSIGNKPLSTQVARATMRAMDDCPLASYNYKGDPVDLSPMAAAFVNQDHAIVKDLMVEIKAKKLLREFSGTQLGDEYAICQVYAFWRLLRDKDISYSSITDNGRNNTMDGELRSQRIRLLEDVIRETQANCVDGTALFASCIGAVGITPIMVLVPSHAFLGYVLGSDKEHGERRLYLETTMLGDNAEQTIKAYKPYFDKEPFAKIRKILYAQFNAGKTTQNNEIDLFVAATMEGYEKITVNKEKYPKESVKEINIKEIQAWGVAPLPTRLKKNGAYAPVIGNNNPLVPPATIIPPKSDVVAPNDGTIGSRTSLTSLRERKGLKSYDDVTFQTTAPDKSCYKLQLERATKYQSEKDQYKTLKKYGALYAEFLPATNNYRVIVGEFAKVEDAYPAARQAQSVGFNNATIVRYFNGNRAESLYQDWKLLKD